MLKRFGGLLGLLSLCLFSLSGNGFAGDALKDIVKELSKDELNGRRSRSEGSVEARKWLIKWLEQNEFQPAGTDGSYEQTLPAGVNILAMVGPSDKPPKVLVSAHYDHLVGCRSSEKALSKVCNGAADNGAGVAAAMVGLSRIAKQLKSPVALALWDSEEDSFFGSRHFLDNPTFSMDELKLLINLDIVGLDLFDGMETFHYAIGAESGGAALMEDIKALSGKDLEVNPLSYAFGHYRSDVTPFVEKKIALPFVFFSDGDGGQYHSTADEEQFINYKKVNALADLVGGLALKAVSRDQGYTWRAPVIMQGQAVPNYGDARTLLNFIDTLTKHAKPNYLDEATLARLAGFRTNLEGVLATSTAPMDMQKAMAIGGVARELMALSRAQFIHRL